MNKRIIKYNIVFFCSIIMFFAFLTASSQSVTFKDSRDGKSYKIVSIGNQTWMSENLNYELSEKKCYDGYSSNCKVFGGLYDFETALIVCPAGWHLPSLDEWKILVENLGGLNNAGGKMKYASSWNEPNIIDDNSSGFNGLACGYFLCYGMFYNIGKNAYWWTATEYQSSAYGWSCKIQNDTTKVSFNIQRSCDGLSVRCIKN